MAQINKHRNRKIAGIILATITLSFLAFKVLRDPSDVSDFFEKSDTTLLLVLFLLQCASFTLNAITANLLLMYVGQKIKLLESIKVSVMNKLGNKILPLVGGSVSSFVAYRRLGLPSSSIIFTEIVSSALLFLQYFLFFSFGAIAVPRSYLSLVPRLALLVISLGVGVITAFIFFLSRKENSALLRKFIVKAIHFISLFFPIRIDREELDSKIELGGQEVRRDFSLFFSHKKRAFFIFFLFSVYFFIDVSMLAVAFHAFGVSLSIPLASLGLLLSLMLSLLTLFPGQPGVTETSLVLVFTSFGIPAHSAILATLAFRVITYWMWLPLSMYFAVAHKKKEITIST